MASDAKQYAFRWFCEKADLEQGAYYMVDPDRNKVAVVFPEDRTIPIERGGNARLYTRDFGSEDWKPCERNDSLHGAKARGHEHARRYRKERRIAERENETGAGKRARSSVRSRSRKRDEGRSL